MRLLDVVQCNRCTWRGTIFSCSPTRAEHDTTLALLRCPCCHETLAMETKDGTLASVNAKVIAAQ